MTQIQLQALNELKKLKEAQIITEAEFATLKEKILTDNESLPPTNLTSNDNTQVEEGHNKSNLQNLWITVGTIAFFAVVLIIYFIATNNKSSYSNSYDNYDEAVEVEEWGE